MSILDPTVIGPFSAAAGVVPVAGRRGLRAPGERSDDDHGDGCEHRGRALPFLSHDEYLRVRAAVRDAAGRLPRCRQGSFPKRARAHYRGRDRAPCRARRTRVATRGSGTYAWRAAERPAARTRAFAHGASTRSGCDVTRFNLTDPALEPIAAKVMAGERLSREDGIALYASNDLIGIGQMADFARRRINGERVYFMVNRHINPTNICRNRCKFCAFARVEGRGGRLRDDARRDRGGGRRGRGRRRVRDPHRVAACTRTGATTSTSTWCGASARPCPTTSSSRRSPPSRSSTWRSSASKPTLEVLRDLKDAGLDALPGGGAEIFSDRTRAAAWEKKTSSDVWLRIHGEAHSLGHRHELHDALRPHRDASRSGSTTWSGCASSRTPPAASSRSSRWRSTRPTPRWPTCRRPPASTTSRRSRSAG